MLPGSNGARTAVAIPAVSKDKIINPEMMPDVIRNERNNLLLLTKDRRDR